jgi:hypothetical protein
MPNNGLIDGECDKILLEIVPVERINRSCSAWYMRPWHVPRMRFRCLEGYSMHMKSGYVLAALALLCAVPVAAHHSFSVEYDIEKAVKVTGSVTKLEWTNPHARLYVDVVGKDGTTTNWNFEMASPNILERNGWSRRSVNPNDTVVVEGYGGRVAGNRGIANSVTFSDGRALFAGAPDTN